MVSSSQLSTKELSIIKSKGNNFVSPLHVKQKRAVPRLVTYRPEVGLLALPQCDVRWYGGRLAHRGFCSRWDDADRVGHA